jgi:hypothetical protein
MDLYAQHRLLWEVTKVKRRREQRQLEGPVSGTIACRLAPTNQRILATQQNHLDHGTSLDYAGAVILQNMYQAKSPCHSPAQQN